MSKLINKNINNYLIREPLKELFEENKIDWENLPLVSFCIPTLNNDRTLDYCLKSIQNQNYPNIEIVIVDGNSRDSTISIAKKYTDKIFFYDGLLGGARQKSIDNSSGEVLALMDSDIILPHENWLRNAILYFNYSKRTSTVWPINTNLPNGSLTSRLYFNHWRIIIEDRIKKHHGLFGGGNALFLRNAIENIGGINKAIHWGEDFDWAMRLKEKGYQVVMIDDALYHDTMNSLGEFARKQFIGARTFTATGFGIMDLKLSDIIHEQIILGLKEMIRGLLINHDISWVLFPICLTIKLTAYFYSYILRILYKQEEI